MTAHRVYVLEVSLGLPPVLIDVIQPAKVCQNLQVSLPEVVAIVCDRV